MTSTTPSPDAWQRGPYSALGTVGVLTPPANTTLEPELTTLLPRGLSLHASRLPGRVQEDTGVGLRERFLGYHEALASSADTFGGLPLDVLLYGVTGSVYLLDEADEAEITHRLRAGGAHHTTTAAGAIRAVLDALGATTVALVSPYPDWVTEAAIAYWRARGIVVSNIQKALESGSIYTIPTESVVAAVRRLDLDRVDAVILSGTGMPTLAAIGALADEIGVPILASTSSMVWWAVDQCAPEALSGAHPLIRRLDERIRRGR
jgi:maleate cis-trans isomerase